LGEKGKLQKDENGGRQILEALDKTGRGGCKIQVDEQICSIGGDILTLEKRDISTLG
jgi:hypothetical protein